MFKFLKRITQLENKLESKEKYVHLLQRILFKQHRELEAIKFYLFTNGESDLHKFPDKVDKMKEEFYDQWHISECERK